MPNTDTTNLERHRQQWRVIVKVPEAARPVIGKAHLKMSLGTNNLATANLLKPPIVSRFKAQIEHALREVQPGDYQEEARLIRDARQLHPVETREVTYFPRPGDEVPIEAVVDDAALVEDLAERLERSHGEDYAQDFANVALGRSTPIKEHLQAFKDDVGYQPKSILELDRAVLRLTDWLASTKRKQTLEGVTSDVANGFMRHMIHGMELSAKSAGKYVSFLRSYWKWLGEQKHVKVTDVWSAPLPKAKLTGGRHTNEEPDEGKRPYTADELKKLLTGRPADAQLLDLIRLGALTGMRLEEIYRLRVRDVVDGFFLVRDGKTVNAKRRIPVHTALKGLVEGLQKGKEAGDYLVDPTAPVIEKTGIRSGAASKAFGYYRKSLKLDERPNDKAKSNIDFHSLRRWFIASARDGILAGATGYNQWTIADVVGHGDGLTDTLKMTLGVYPGKSADTALKACVAAVQLPKGI